MWAPATSIIIISRTTTLSLPHRLTLCGIMLRKQITHGHDYGHLVDGAGGYGEGDDGRRSTQHLMRIVRGPARFWSCQDDNSSFKLKSMMRKLMPQNQVVKKKLQNMRAGCSNVASTYGGFPRPAGRATNDAKNCSRLPPARHWRRCPDFGSWSLELGVLQSSRNHKKVLMYLQSPGKVRRTKK